VPEGQKVAGDFDKAMKQIDNMGFLGDKETEKPTLKGKHLNNGNAVSDFRDPNFNTGITDNLTNQMSKQQGIFFLELEWHKGIAALLLDLIMGRL